MRAVETDIVAIDFEATGVVGEWPDEPWQVGMIRIRHGKIMTAPTFESLLQVGDRPVSPYATGRYNQYRYELLEAPRLTELWPQLRSWWFGSALAAHNVATEKKFIRQAAPLHRAGPWIDTLKLMRVAYPNLISHKLEDLLAELEFIEDVQRICPGREAHDAIFDAAGCALLLVHLLQQDGWTDATIDDLAGAHPNSYYQQRFKQR